MWHQFIGGHASMEEAKCRMIWGARYGGGTGSSQRMMNMGLAQSI